MLISLLAEIDNILGDVKKIFFITVNYFISPLPHYKFEITFYTCSKR
jgi:hypothetical protein